MKPQVHPMKLTIIQIATTTAEKVSQKATTPVAHLLENCADDKEG